MKFSLLDRVLGVQAPVPDDNPGSANREYRLESVLHGAFFNAVIQAWWLPATMGCEGIVFPYLRREASAAAGRFSVVDVTAANDEMNASLARSRVIPDSSVQLISARVMLTVGEDHLRFAEQRAAIDRQANIEAAQLEATHARLMRLRDVFLTDVATAGLWWSNGDPDRVLDLADKTTSFDSIVSMVARSPASPGQADLIATLVGRFLADLGPAHRELLIGQLTKVFESYQRPDLAEELRTAGS